MWSLALAYLPVLVLVMAVGLLADARGIPMEDVTRDVAAVARVPFYTGALSTVGLMGWCATTAICFFTACLLGRGAAARPSAAFFLAAGALTGILLADDAFLVHEVLAPHHLGLADETMFAIYGIATLAFLVAFHRDILYSDFLLLGLALALLAASAGIDKLADAGRLPLEGKDGRALGTVVEDALKLLGVAGWCAYFARTGWSAVTGDAARRAAAEARARRD